MTFKLSAPVSSDLTCSGLLESFRVGADVTLPFKFPISIGLTCVHTCSSRVLTLPARAVSHALQAFSVQSPTRTVAMTTVHPMDSEWHGLGTPRESASGKGWLLGGGRRNATPSRDAAQARVASCDSHALRSACRTSTVEMTHRTILPVKTVMAVTSVAGVFFLKAVSLITLCREDPHWPVGRYRARDQCGGAL